MVYESFIHAQVIIKYLLELLIDIKKETKIVNFIIYYNQFY